MSTYEILIVVFTVISIIVGLLVEYIKNSRSVTTEPSMQFQFISSLSVLIISILFYQYHQVQDLQRNMHRQA